MSERKVSFTNSRGQKLAGVLHAPKKKTDRGIVLAHGFAYNKDEDGEFVYAARKFCDNGIAALRFDFEGCGDSGGKFANTLQDEVDDLKSAIELMKKKGYKRIGLVGASMGGLIALKAAEAGEANTLVLWSPVVFAKKTVGKMDSRVKGWKNEIKKGGSFSLQKPGQRNVVITKDLIKDLNSTNALLIGPKIKAKTMILHGDADKTVDYNDSWELFKTISGAKIEIIHGADHNFHNSEKDREIATEMSIGWFEQFL